MLYIKEIYYRFLLSLFNVVLSLAVLYYYKNFLFDFIILPFILSDNPFNSYFIYTHPVEFTKILISVVFLFLIIFILPYLLFIFFDFFRSGLYEYEFYFLRKIIFILTFFLYFLNFICFIEIFPLIWKFFNEMNNYSSNIFLELKLENYFYFLLEYTFIINIFYFFTVFILALLFLNDIIMILNNKKLLILLIILVSTIISPPEISLQMLLFCFFYFSLEIFLFCYFFFHYLNLEKR